MFNYENCQNMPNPKNSNNYETSINKNREILSMINEHKKKLNEIRNKDIDDFIENKKYIKANSLSFENIKTNKEKSAFDKTVVDDSIRVAKEFLKYNKEKTSRIFNDIDSNLNININNQNNSKKEYNYNYSNNLPQNFNYINYNCKTHKDFHTNLNNAEILYNHNSNNNYLPLNVSEVKKIQIPNLIYGNEYNINEKVNYILKNKNYNNEDNTLAYSNIILKHKLDYAEEKINSLESNIDILTKENYNLRQYIIQLENNNINCINNNNKGIEKDLMEEENNSVSKVDDIILNKEKIMFSINNFIKKMYGLLQNFGKEQNFESLKFEQYNELQQHLKNIENIINDLFIQNIKKVNYSLNSLNGNSISDIISTIEYTKKGKKKPKIHKIIKKLESKSANKLKKRNKTKNNLYNFENNSNKNGNNHFNNVIGYY